MALTTSPAVVGDAAFEFKSIVTLPSLTLTTGGLTPPRFVLVTKIRVPLPSGPVWTARNLICNLLPALKFDVAAARLAPSKTTGE